MSIAGYQKAVRIRMSTGSTSSTAFRNFPATSATLTLAGDVLDDTTLLSTGFRSRILGLRDWSIAIPSIFESTNESWGFIRQAWLGRKNVDVQYLPLESSTKGFQGTAWVETFSFSGDVGGLETVDVNLVAESQLSTI